jgi:putative nucleotidyltransferase-like protein
MATSYTRDLIVLAAREPSAERDAALASAVRGVRDWTDAALIAQDHGVLPLLSVALRGAQLTSAVPASDLRHIQTLAAAMALKSTALLRVLAEIETAMEARGLRPLVLKGPALALMLYPSPGLRPFNDLDILCQPRNLEAAGHALRELGFEARDQGSREQEGFHTVYQSASRSALVELHSDLLQLGVPTRCASDLWTSPDEFQLGGVRCHTLQAEFQVLHLCVHLHTHGYGRLIWFKDLDLLLRRFGDAIDWPFVDRLARDEGTALSVRHTLTTLGKLLGTPIPPGALRGLSFDPVGEIAHAALWPERRVLSLRSKQRLRSLRFNPRLGPMGVLPSLVVMGRRREKLARLVHVGTGNRASHQQ